MGHHVSSNCIVLDIHQIVHLGCASNCPSVEKKVRTTTFGQPTTMVRQLTITPALGGGSGHIQSID